MILQKQLFEEIELIPVEKYPEIYDLLHDFRLNLTLEKINAEPKADSVFKILSQLSDDFMNEGRQESITLTNAGRLLMYMLDTNICIYIKNNKPTCVLEKLQSLNADQVCISSITYAELFYGAMKSQQPIKNIEQIIALKNAIPILNFDETAAEKYGEIRADLENKV